jgi:hypothetical protein
MCDKQPGKRGFPSPWSSTLYTHEAAGLPFRLCLTLARFLPQAIVAALLPTVRVASLNLNKSLNHLIGRICDIEKCFVTRQVLTRITKGLKKAVSFWHKYFVEKNLRQRTETAYEHKV